MLEINCPFCDNVMSKEGYGYGSTRIDHVCNFCKILGGTISKIHIGTEDNNVVWYSVIFGELDLYSNKIYGTKLRSVDEQFKELLLIKDFSPINLSEPLLLQFQLYFDKLKNLYILQ